MNSNYFNISKLYRTPENSMSSSHTHSFWELFYLTKGSCSILIRDALYEIKSVFNEAIQGDDEALVFDSNDIREDRYIDFVESRFAKDLQPCQIQDILKEGTVSLTAQDKDQAIREYKNKHNQNEPDEETTKLLLLMTSMLTAALISFMISV